MASQSCPQNVFILRRPSRVANFADIVKIASTCIKNNTQRLKKDIRYYVLKFNLYLHLLI